MYLLFVLIKTLFVDSECSQKSKAKRVRTTFTEDQLQVLQANFQLDSNPDGQDLERIAQITGLSKRVTQVWFQNSRARQKKQQQGGEHTSPSSNSSPSKPHSKLLLLFYKAMYLDAESAIENIYLHAFLELRFCLADGIDV